MIRLKILLSYWYYRTIDLDQLFSKYFTEPYPEVFADSGAFSAFTQNVVIAPADYAKWINRWKHLFVAYSNLDVIGSAAGTLTNQKVLEEMGLAPLPVFHAGESYDDLASYIEQYPYIAIGGMVPYMKDAKTKLMPFLIKCFKMAEDKSVFHGFGCTSWNVLKSFRWYSVDSSTWGTGFRFGKVPLFDPTQGKFVEILLGNRASVYKYTKLIRSSGFDPEDFADRVRNDRSKICGLSAISYLQAEKWLQKRHGEVLIPRNNKDVGLSIHLADANPQRFIDAGAGLRLNLADTSNGFNYRDADRGIKIHLVDTRNTLGDLGSANEHVERVNGETRRE